MSSPLRTLHVFPGFAVGGAQVRAARLVDALGDGFEHAVVSLDGGRAGYALLREPDRLEWVDPPPRRGSLRTIVALRRLLCARRPDLVLTYNWGAIDAVVAARLAGVRALVHHEDGFGPEEVVQRIARRSFFRRAVLGAAHRVVVPSRVLERVALDEWRLDPELVELIPNGVDLERCSPGSATPDPKERAALGIPADALCVVSVGGLRPEKRPDRLLEAIALVPRAHAIVVGDGPLAGALAERAARADLAGRVHLLGPRPDPVPALRAADVFCISSDTEQMPIAMVEGMGVGLAVAATDVGDVAHILPDEQRAFVSPVADDAAGLARSFAALWADPDRRARLGAANRARALERYRFEAMAERYRALYRAAAARS